MDPIFLSSCLSMFLFFPDVVYERTINIEVGNIPLPPPEKALHFFRQAVKVKTGSLQYY